MTYAIEITSPSSWPRAQVIAELQKHFPVDAAAAEKLFERTQRGSVAVARSESEAVAQKALAGFMAAGFEARIIKLQPELVASGSGRSTSSTATSSTQVTSSTQAPAPRKQATIVPEPEMPMPKELEADIGDLETGNQIGDQTFNQTVDQGVTDAPARRISLATKFLSAAILPTLLAVGMAIAAILLTVPGAMRTMQLEAARNPAVALSSGIEGLLAGNALDAKVTGQLQASLSASQANFQAQNVEFVIVTDALGNPLAGWYGQTKNIGGLPSEIRAYVQTQARRATAQDFIRKNNLPVGTYNPPARLVDAAGTPLEVAAHPISKNGLTVGTTVIGMSSTAVSNRVQSTVMVTLLASALPVLLAILIAALLARSITRNVLALVKAADLISMGELENPVTVRTNDELNDLGAALERMRVSLQESLNRLRRRRK